MESTSAGCHVIKLNHSNENWLKCAFSGSQTLSILTWTCVIVILCENFQCHQIQLLQESAQIRLSPMVTKILVPASRVLHRTKNSSISRTPGSWVLSRLSPPKNAGQYQAKEDNMHWQVILRNLVLRVMSLMVWNKGTRVNHNQDWWGCHNLFTYFLCLCTLVSFPILSQLKSFRVLEIVSLFYEVNVEFLYCRAL